MKFEMRVPNRGSRGRLLKASLAAAAMVWAAPAWAELSAEELAKLAQNPVGNLIGAPIATVN